MKCPTCGYELDPAGWCKRCIDKPYDTPAQSERVEAFVEGIMLGARNLEWNRAERERCSQPWHPDRSGE